MNELFPDYLLDYARFDRILFAPFEQLGQAITFDPHLHVLNVEASLEQQVYSLTNAIIRYHPRFISYTGGLLYQDMPRDSAMEEQIESLAFRVLEEVEGLQDVLEDRITAARIRCDPPLRTWN